MKPHAKKFAAASFGHMTVKYHAHALTLFSVFWVIPSLMGLVMFFSGARDEIPLSRRYLPLIPTAMHVVFIGMAIYYWITERKRRVVVLKSEGDIGI